MYFRESIHSNQRTNSTSKRDFLTKVFTLFPVTDVNDNPPVFERSSYDVLLSEEVSRGHFVASVSVFDIDVSDECKHTYSIIEGNQLEAFSLEPSTGKLKNTLQILLYTLDIRIIITNKIRRKLSLIILILLFLMNLIDINKYIYVYIFKEIINQ